MKVVEEGASSSVNAKDHSSQTNKLTFKDIKAFVKIGIVNSNLLAVFTGYWLALYVTGISFIETLDVFTLTIAGSTLVLIGASVLNNWYDTDIDIIMDRTRNRPTVTKKIASSHVLMIGIVTTVLGLILLYMTTLTAAIVSFVGWFTYVVLYTMWSKRRYTLNTEIGCISGAVPPLIGWAAIHPDLFHIIPITVFMIMFIWQTPHFLSLAIKNRKQYKLAGVPMLPAVYGTEFTKRQIIVYIICLFPLPFFLYQFGIIFLTIITTLNIVWILIAFSGLFMKNVYKWANVVFFYSLAYLIIFFGTLIYVAT
ncbi:MAG TPA: heme o synthase [Pseudogracilibacillus sp.]|nr:heme o synthase [Pseudogracilibacillus sp.]